MAGSISDTDTTLSFAAAAADEGEAGSFSARFSDVPLSTDSRTVFLEEFSPTILIRGAAPITDVAIVAPQDHEMTSAVQVRQINFPTVGSALDTLSLIFDPIKYTFPQDLITGEEQGRQEIGINLISGAYTFKLLLHILGISS